MGVTGMPSASLYLASSSKYMTNTSLIQVLLLLYSICIDDSWRRNRISIPAARTCRCSWSRGERDVGQASSLYGESNGTDITTELTQRASRQRLSF